ncbi:MAG: prepilin peptidase [Clostridia bacterium]|nr:prepilin peptidase [Clostridia bacterium]
MDAFLYTIIFMIGTLFGSFFTLAVYRIPLGKDITHERSFCPNCNHKLSFLDMIPIFSYLFLGGKCRYCKQKIRIRYLLLEVLSGLIFVLFALSIKFNILALNVSTIVYFIFGLFYLATLFIISGIDKEKHQIQKSVLLFGYIIETVYIIYLYIVEKDPNVYRYVIYLSIICILTVLDIVWLRKKVKNSYLVEILLLGMLLLTFTYEAVTILTIIFTIFASSFYLLLKKLVRKKKKNVQSSEKSIVIPIGFYLCVTNIICLIVSNFYIFY